jgi:signal peptidase I
MSDRVKSILREVLITLLEVIAVLCIGLFVINYVGQRSEVSGSSMEPTLYQGDNLIIDKVTYRFNDPERFDVISFRFRGSKNSEKPIYYIKRIIGLPGETVYIDQGGNIYIDGVLLEEDFGKEDIRPDHIGIAGVPITLGENEYFVMGDNRNNSSDSRSHVVGNVSREDIIGRAWLRIWPLGDIGFLKHG